MVRVCVFGVEIQNSSNQVGWYLKYCHQQALAVKVRAVCNSVSFHSRKKYYQGRMKLKASVNWVCLLKQWNKRASHKTSSVIKHLFSLVRMAKLCYSGSCLAFGVQWSGGSSCWLVGSCPHHTADIPGSCSERLFCIAVDVQHYAMFKSVPSWLWLM